VAPITKLAEEDGSYRRVEIIPANPVKHRGITVNKYVFNISLSNYKCFVEWMTKVLCISY